MKTHYIGADVDSKMTEIAVERGPGVFDRYRVATSIAAIREVLGRLDGRKFLATEEGPLADWLYRNLKDHVDKLVVSDPRRNRLIAHDGDKTDPIDASKLAVLLRGGYLRPVYHAESQDRADLKRWVQLYHDRVKTAVRELLKIRSRCLMEGERPARGVREDAARRAAWLKGLSNRALAQQVEVLWIGYDAARRQVRQSRQAMMKLAKAMPIVAEWQKVPGVGPIRAVTFLAFVDTPQRFKAKNRLWKYGGVGLIRRASGTGRSGVPNRGLLRLAYCVNRRLKDTLVGAATSAIQQGDNVFAAHYERMVREGKTPSNARHTVARQIAGVLWGMWKSNRPFDPSLAAPR